ncbi:MAG: hypothetical protein WCS94_15365 [Verrucomicrobiota bacterium]
MKKNYIWLLFIVVVVLITALLIWRRPYQRIVEPMPTNSASVQTNHAPNGVLVSSVIAVTKNNSTVFIDTNRLIRDKISQLEEFTQAYNKHHNIPVDFYGKIIDQNSNPVVGAKINVTVRQQYVISAIQQTSSDTEIPLEATSGRDGCFTIQGEKGDSLHMDSIQKGGYKLAPKIEKTYEYASNSIEPFHPDSQNPVVIRMWKLGEPAQLVSQDKDTRIPYDGTPVIFNLLTGQQNVGAGDLRVTLIRNPLNITNGYKQAFEWHATIEAINGGLLQSDDEFMYEAPEQGYQPKIQIDMPADTNKWANIYDISFYAKTRNEHVYSWVKLEFRVDSPKTQTGFTITSAANPNGSRNLQP